MKRRSRAGGKPVEALPRKALKLKGRKTPTAVARRGSAPTDPTVVARLTRERDEALQQKTAMSEVLRLISSSPRQLESVFQAILANATRLCDATFGDIFRCKQDGLHLVASYNTPTAFAEVLRHQPEIRPWTTKLPIHHADLTADPRYIERSSPTAVAAVELGGVRTNLVVPMLQGNELIGTFVLNRQEVRPFTRSRLGWLPTSLPRLSSPSRTRGY
jgi:GAF domain-containing protein